MEKTLTDVLPALAEQMKITTEVAWQILVAGQRVDAIAVLVCLGIAVIVCAIMACMQRKWEGSSGCTFDAMLVALLTLAVIALPLFFLYGAIVSIAAPEYAALWDLAHAIGR